jgi:hypothetical protein
VLLAYAALGAVVARVGHAAPTLDDAYIHFQYARAIAEGHPLRFQAGEPITSGATSLLWPLVLAPFWAVGLRGHLIVWPAWAISFAALGALALEAAKLAERLAGRAAAAGAAAMTLAFGGFVWSAASGMEGVPFAWALARLVRRASEWAEAGGEAEAAGGERPGRTPERTDLRAAELVALAWAAALLRPEGGAAAFLAAATLATRPRASAPRPRKGGGASSGALRDRFAAAAALGAAAFVPLLLWALTGSPRANTAVAKLLPGNPYYQGWTLVAAVAENARVLVSTILDGEVWSAEFLPRGGTPLAIAGLVAIALRGWRSAARFRAAAVLALAMMIFAPCFYSTFLWNRLRYLWPFATGWIVGLSCLARLLGDLAGQIRPRWRGLTPIACGGFAGLLGAKLDWVIQDIAQSAGGIERQQVALGRWAHDNLTADARVGVNDTGAIAYYGERRTFDVVGLTSADEARYWVAGAGSRLEHYERMARATPTLLPAFFIVYPEWLGLPMVLGTPLYEVTVTDSTILGGQTMRAYAADWSALGSGEQPWTPLPGPLTDVVDVADLESEAQHGYELLGAREGEEVAQVGASPGGRQVIDGGRSRRTAERFAVHLLPKVDAKCIVRLAGDDTERVRVYAEGEAVDAFDLETDAGADRGNGGAWVERSFAVPARAARDRTALELRPTQGTMTTFHYWCASAPPQQASGKARGDAARAGPR